jgi:hypothetical protein
MEIDCTKGTVGHLGMENATYSRGCDLKSLVSNKIGGINRDMINGV